MTLNRSVTAVACSRKNALVARTGLDDLQHSATRGRRTPPRMCASGSLRPGPSLGVNQSRCHLAVQQTQVIDPASRSASTSCRGSKSSWRMSRRAWYDPVAPSLFRCR